MKQLLGLNIDVCGFPSVAVLIINNWIWFGLKGCISRFVFQIYWNISPPGNIPIQWWREVPVSSHCAWHSIRCRPTQNDVCQTHFLVYLFIAWDINYSYDLVNWRTCCMLFAQTGCSFKNDIVWDRTHGTRDDRWKLYPSPNIQTFL